MSRSVGTVFEDKGFSVVRAASGTLALNFARRSHPDVVLLDDAPGALDAISVCRALRDDPLLDPATPLIVTSSANLGTSKRAAAYEAGAWEYCSQPLDIEQLLLKIRTFLRARDAVTTARGQHCLDSTTGLYTAFGLEQVSYQLRAQAARAGKSITCLTVAAELVRSGGAAGGSGLDGSSAVADVANICRLHARKSDFIGHAGPARVAILAPDTDAAGARALLARLQEQLDGASRSGAVDREYRLRAGYCSMSDAAGAKLAPADLIGRASSALEHLRHTDSPDSLLGFEQLEGA